MERQDNISEHQLIDALKGGSISAFNIIYVRYAGRLLSYIAAATRSKQDAEDLVHDIFLSLWKNRRNIRPDTRVDTYLFSLAYRRRVDFFREQMRLPIFEDYLDFANELVADDGGGGARIEYRDFCDMFDLAVAKLPARLRNFVEMSRIRGLGDDEIAARLHVSRKTVSNGISLGLKLLRENLRLLREKHNL